MPLDFTAIRNRIAAQIVWCPPLYVKTPLDDLDALIAEIDRLTPLADAAAAWAAAVAEPNGVYDAERALLAAVKAWQQGTIE